MKKLIWLSSLWLFAACESLFSSHPIVPQTITRFAVTRAIINERCLSCHSRQPTDPLLRRPPSDIVFDSNTDIQKFAQRIKIRAVLSKTMPPGLPLSMPQEERAILGKWVDEGANIPSQDSAQTSPIPVASRSIPTPSPPLQTPRPTPTSLPSPSPSPIPTLSPSSSPIPTLSPSSSPTPTLSPSPEPTPSPITFKVLQGIINQRCNVCHSFDSYSRLQEESQRIKTRAVLQMSMPPPGSQPANEITLEERRQIGQWVDEGARPD